MPLLPPVSGGGWLSSSGGKGVLHYLLGEVEVAEDAGEHRDSTAVFSPEDLVDHQLCIGLTSIDNGLSTRASLLAHLSASSRSAAG